MGPPDCPAHGLPPRTIAGSTGSCFTPAGGTHHIKFWRRWRVLTPHFFRDREACSPLHHSADGGALRSRTLLAGFGAQHDLWIVPRCVRRDVRSPLNPGKVACSSIDTTPALKSGAGSGNRTRVASLEGWCSTIELHPQIGDRQSV